MRHPEPVTLLQKLAERTAPGAPGPKPRSHKIPVTNYTNQGRFEREIALFHTLPLLIAHESQMPNCGDALVYDCLGKPLITMRDKSGEIGTFLNVCRHRGMRLIQDEGRACVNSLVCPYHQWTYGLDGTLRNIPRSETFTDIDPSEYSLMAVPTEVRNGLIWVQIEGKMDLDDHLSSLDADFDVFEIADYCFNQQSVRTIGCNWKLIQDAFLDGYHVVRLHKNTVGQFFPDAISESNSIGRHIRSAVARNEIFEAAGKAPQELDLRREATFSYTVFPNSIVIFHPDYTSIITLRPLSPDKTVFTHTMLTPHEPSSDKEREHYRRSFELIDEGVFAAEDIFVSVGAQRGMRSGANEALLFGGLEEAAIRFHQTLGRSLKGTETPQKV
jgi:phenylpropionate dioxygenase-like ring-hydroxylating dioxygenase large terminal subunit